MGDLPESWDRRRHVWEKICLTIEPSQIVDRGRRRGVKELISFLKPMCKCRTHTANYGPTSVANLAGLSPTPDINEMEGQIPLRYGSDATEIPGARSLISALSSNNVPWAVVTSGTRPLVNGWLKILQMPEPANLTVATDVTNGKPDPEGYALGWNKLGLEDGSTTGRTKGLVLEDAPAGIRAGKAAGFRVVAVATTHTIEEIKLAKPDWIVKDLSSVKFKGWDAEKGLATIEISNILRE
jgi:HAD superfamily hydrolase (TIGR01509 family)